MPRATLHKLCDIPHFKGADLETLQRLLQAHGIESSFHVHVPDARAYTANDAFRTAMLALPAGQWPPSALRSVRTLLTAIEEGEAVVSRLIASHTTPQTKEGTE